MGDAGNKKDASGNWRREGAMNILQILALVLASAALGMQLGRALTLWEKQPQDGNDQGGESQD